MMLSWPEVVALGALVLGTVVAYGVRLYFTNRCEDNKK